MQDKTFSQAMLDLEERVSSHSQEAMYRMLLQRTTATVATVDIADEKMRTIVTNELIHGQINALLALLRDLHVLDEGQYAEFTAYLRRALASHYHVVATGQD